MGSQHHITIVGGGIMGLSIAYRLAFRSQGNITITLIDEGEEHPSASSQAAGILATHGAQHFLSPLRRQIVQSILHYPEFLAELGKTIGQGIEGRVGYHPLPHFHLYDPRSPEQKAVWKKRIRRMEREKADDGKTVALPSFLAPFLKGSGYFLSEIIALEFHSHIVEPKKLLEALRNAGEILGVQYINGKVTKTEDRGNGVSIEYQNTDQTKKFYTGKIVLASGSGTTDLLSEIQKNSEGIPLENRLKSLSGAILIIEPFLPQGREILITLYNKRYLLHKSDRVFYGSYDWKDQAGEHGTVNYAEGILKSDLYRLFPPLENSPPQTLEILTGRRLYHSDKLPLLGYLTRNTFIATALYKSGLSLAPLYSNLATEMLLRKPEDLPQELIAETDFLSPLRRKVIDSIP